MGIDLYKDDLTTARDDDLYKAIESFTRMKEPIEIDQGKITSSITSKNGEPRPYIQSRRSRIHLAAYS